MDWLLQAPSCRARYNHKKWLCATLCLPELSTCPWMRMHQVIRTGEDTMYGSMCWMCRYHKLWWWGLPSSMFSLAIFAGVNGENSGRARSDWPACQNPTTLMNQFVAGRRNAWSTGAISTTKPSSLGTVKKGRHPMSKVNILISSFLKLLFNDEAVSHGKLLSMIPSLRTGAFLNPIILFLYRRLILIHYTHKCDETIYLSVTQEKSHSLPINCD